MASDFHTHYLPADHCRALLSTSDPQAGEFVSLEYHPWHLPENFTVIPQDFPEKLAGFNALGEIGLDKLHGASPDIQLHCLEQLLQLAHEMNKPVVLHVVRCYQEIFALLKRFSLRVMVHGFCGSPELLDELWKRDITVSFPVNALKKTALMDKLTAPRGRFGFESDCNQNISVNEIINKSMIPGVEKMTDQYFNDFLGI
ncbi:MAG: TatD family hydrolase [Lentisphaeria bacterium]|nr:TatD family hydrolase [Lentisphaeria bacterium]